MEYDATDLPRNYDRARTRSPAVMSRWLDRIADALPRSARLRTILDLGCGTGRFSGALHSRFGAGVVGIDPSERMLRQAYAKPTCAGCMFVRGEAERIPLRDESVDLLFMSMVIHHVSNRSAALRECARVLSTGGVVFVRTGVRDRIGEYPTSPYFPESVPIMERMLPSTDDLSDLFGKAGLRPLNRGIVHQEIAATHRDFVEQVAAGADSVLAQLAPATFDEGLDRLRAAAARWDPLPVREPIDFFVFARAALPGQ